MLNESSGIISLLQDLHLTQSSSKVLSVSCLPSSPSSHYPPSSSLPTIQTLWLWKNMEMSNVDTPIQFDEMVLRNISGSSLKGFLAPELGKLTHLQELILHGNNLIGTIPRELGDLKYLRSNGLTGRLPPELGNLRFLQELQLDRNRLQGPIPAGDSSNFASNMHGMYVSKENVTGFCRSSQLKVKLSRELHPEPGYKAATSYTRVLLLPVPRVSQWDPSHQLTEYVSKHHGASKPVWLLALEIVTGTMVGSLFLVAVLAAFQRCNKKSSIIIPWKKSRSQKDQTPVYIDPEMLKDVRRYSRQELEVACEDFSNIIGSSPDSVVYKGTMKGGPEIAVISLCIREEHWTGYLELYFQREVNGNFPMATACKNLQADSCPNLLIFTYAINAIQVADLAKLNHENIGKLLGYCREDTLFTRMLVFDYASNGTLHDHLHCYEKGCQFSWTRRMKIAIGIARGLKYLHTEVEPPFTISELNSSAVYLTEEFSPKLVDFESWKTILERSEKNSGSIGSQGAICVLPNSLEARHLDTKGNIFAFGVLLLELISRRPPYCKDKGYLVDWAKDYLERPDEMSSVLDPELKHFSHEDLKVICEQKGGLRGLALLQCPSSSHLDQLLAVRLECRLVPS
ncbi:LRR receptor-like serine/threonine-protein [Vigna angularis]|uniref:LRR receptor-like serine/threonine-protein n=1 Tax=Phaseolus angularis TaxID=3914 RepID=A0A8T0KWI7_PHAAN|nr:LRR receptor-like serine/threonine-protein [Vigna angularis]